MNARGLILGLLSLGLSSASLSGAEALPLWVQGAPGALGQRSEDKPTLTPWWPDPGKANGTAIIVCPGGGYGGLTAREGEPYARWLNAHGIAAFVLRYRLGSKGYHDPAQRNDIARAARLVRANAEKWHLDPRKIGVIGSSAGGHLASLAVTHFDAGDPAALDPVERQSSRPDFGILCYAVITMGEKAEPGSRARLLGPNPPPDLANFLSSEKQVRDDTPPCFVWSAQDDKVVNVANSLVFAAALGAHGVPYELHIYQGGRHGLGLGYDRNLTHPGQLLPWTADLLRWMGQRGLLKR